MIMRATAMVLLVAAVAVLAVVAVTRLLRVEGGASRMRAGAGAGKR